MTAKQRLALYLPPVLRKQIEDSASDKGQTLSVWMERAAIAYLAAEKVRQQPAPRLTSKH